MVDRTAESSDLIAPETSKGEQQNQPFQWKSKWQNCVYFLSLTMSWKSLVNYSVGDSILPTAHPINIIHVIVGYVFFGCPLLFLQTFIGQFGQRGCLVLGSMMPFSCGLGYFMLVNTILEAILNMYNSTISLFYVLVAIVNHPTPAWMLCIDDYYKNFPNCVGRREIELCDSCHYKKWNKQVPCFDLKTQKLSSYFFMENIVLSASKAKESTLTVPDRTFLYLFCAIVLMSFIAITRAVKEIDGPLRMWNIFTISSLTVMTVVILFTSERFQGLLFFFKISWRSLFDLKCWTKTLEKIIDYLKLSGGGLILFGSYTPVTVNTGVRACYLTFVHFVVLLIFSAMSFTLLENFACQINTSEDVFAKRSIRDHVYAINPESLGILAAAPTWGTLYFSIAFGLALQSVILQIIITEASLGKTSSDSSYNIYTRCLLLAFTSFITFFLITPQGSSYIPFIASYLTFYRIFIAFSFYMVILFYGFQRLSDDIHFLLRNPPSSFYLWSWYGSSAASLVALISIVLYAELSMSLVVLFIILTIMVLSLLLGFLYKFIIYLIARDLSAILRPEETWGPSDPEARNNRRLFNPRYEVRFRRKVERCDHRCLLESSVLKETLEKELALLSNVLLEMETDHEHRKWKMHEIEALRLHKSLMTKILTETSFQKETIFHEKLEI